MGVCVFFVKIENKWDEKKTEQKLGFTVSVFLMDIRTCQGGKKKREKAHFDVCVVNKH